MNEEEKKTTTTERGYKVVYVSLSKADYDAVYAAARRNCRSVGGELVYAWREANRAEVKR